MTQRAATVLLVILLVTSLGLKVALAYSTSGQELRGDERNYLMRASSVALHGTYDNRFAPGHIMFLAGAMNVLAPKSWIERIDSIETASDKETWRRLARSGRDVLTWIRLIQCALSTLTVLFLYWIGLHFLSRGGALVAAALFAFNPTMVGFTHYLWSETLFMCVMAAGVALLCWWFSRPRAGVLLAAGWVWGLASLTRAMVLPLSGVALIPMLLMPGRTWKRGLLDFAIFFVAVWIGMAPWTIRNYAVHQEFIPVDTSSGRAFHLSHNAFLPLNLDLGIERRAQELLKSKTPVPAWERLSGATDAETAQLNVQRALQFAREHPGLTLERTALKAKEYWAPTSYMLRCLANGKYGGVPDPGTHRFIIAAQVAFYLLTVGGALVGIFMLRGNPAVMLTLLVIVGHTAMHLATLSFSRYRMPAMPYMALLAGAAFTTSWRTLARIGALRWCVLALLLAGWIWSVSSLMSQYDLFKWP